MNIEMKAQKNDRKDVLYLLAFFGFTAIMMFLCSFISYKAVYIKHGPGAAVSSPLVEPDKQKTGACRVDGKCPEVECVNLKCIPNPDCISKQWPQNHNKCPTVERCDEINYCSERVCPEKKDRSPNTIEQFFNGFIESRTVFEWLDMYPPNSKERLIVITTLLENVLDKWATAGHMHSCVKGVLRDKESAHRISLMGRDERACNFCTDRYILTHVQ